MKKFDNIKEPSIKEFYERCKNIEEEKKQRSIEIHRKKLIEKYGKVPTKEELIEHIRTVAKKMFTDIQSKIKKP